ncbi:type II toxin-antitoxin system CcdA family antitoxin, partial [Thermogladius sp.]|uniref:type II toxin-antitoxin system CcdA family antitoxin n=1 Tax=Thermogladius sp. TaxID=2023064 RepID=UPI003D0DE773
KVRRDVVERARRLGINVSEFLRRVLEEEVEKRGLELLERRLEEIKDVLESLDIERTAGHIREDREARCGVGSS